MKIYPFHLPNMSSTDLHPLGDTLLRSAQTYHRYHDNPKRKLDASSSCFICTATPLILNAKHWRLIHNDFPYDAVATLHLMLVPVRHIATASELSTDEQAELQTIKALLDHEGNFDAVIENLARGRTYLPHYHLHVLQWKRV